MSRCDNQSSALKLPGPDQGSSVPLRILLEELHAALDELQLSSTLSMQRMTVSHRRRWK